MKEYFKVHEFHLLPQKPGVYAWYLYYNKNKRVLDYYKFFKTKDFQVQASSFLKEEYHGVITAQESIHPAVADKSFLEKITLKFSPPIYIGITRDQTLQKRLNDHKLTLQKLINGATIIDESHESQFAGRVTKIIQEKELEIDETDFVVKILEVEGLSSEILDVENFLNRTYHPLCGKN